MSFLAGVHPPPSGPGARPTGPPSEDKSPASSRRCILADEMTVSQVHPMYIMYIPNTTNGTAIGLPPHWGGCGGQWGGSPMAVPLVVFGISLGTLKLRRSPEIYKPHGHTDPSPLFSPQPMPSTYRKKLWIPVQHAPFWNFAPTFKEHQHQGTPIETQETHS